MSTRQAIWKDAVIAESDRTIVVDGNHYFPPESLRREHLEPSETRTSCYWKGTARYYDVVVNGQRNRDSAWYYPNPSAAAQRIAGYVAFWRGVKVRSAPAVGEAAAEFAQSAGGGWLRHRFRSSGRTAYEQRR